MHRKLLRFVNESMWQDRPIREYAAKYALVEMQRHGPVESWILDDTGFLKQGKLSPCVQRQYTGSTGTVTNCQVAVSLTLATAHAHLPVDMQLYMPETWVDDRPRRLEAKVPDDVVYRHKWTIAIEMIEAAMAAGLPPGVVLADSDYGNKTAFRDKLDELGLQYAVAVQKTTKVRRVRGTGGREVGEIQSVEDLAVELDSKDIRTVSWREGTKARMQGQFAVVRVERSPRDGIPRRKQWLVIEWPSDSHLPTKYEVRARDVAAQHVSQEDRASAQGTMAHRTGLRRPQGRAGAGPLRRPLLRRMEPSRDNGLVLLCLPRGRTGPSVSPLGTWDPVSASQRPAPLRGLSVTSPTRW